MSEQLISAREPTVSGETIDCRLTGTEQVRPATVIDVDETAVTVPVAWLVSRSLSECAHVPGPSSAAVPPVVPPILPFANPVVALKSDETLASSLALGSCARPVAKPASCVPLRTASKRASVFWPDATSMLIFPETTPMPSVEFTIDRALIFAGPARSGSPAAVPVYVPSVMTIVLPSDVVHVRDWTLEAVVAVNVPATSLTLFAPSIPLATAIPAAVSATVAIDTSTSMRFISIPSLI